ncbi:hypothetical protein ACW9UR_02260 [Halovulum sp. GXIMD14794]
MTSKIAYAIIEMKPMPKADALLVSEAIVNISFNPNITAFPKELPREHDTGIFVAFGYSDRAVPRYLMTTRTVLETRLNRLFEVTDEPLTLRGELSFNGGIGRTYNVTHADPLHPDYQVELVRIGDGENAE